MSSVDYDSVETATLYLLSKTGAAPDLALIMGSGISVAENLLQGIVEIPFGEIPNFPVPHVAGHRGRAVFGKAGKLRVLIMEGRVHTYEGWSIQEAGFGARVVGRSGAKTVLLTNAAGAINPLFNHGDMMLFSDHINLLSGNPLAGPNEDRWGPRFVDQTEVYDSELRGKLRDCAAACGVPIHEGVYVAVPGPTYETPAEVRYLRTIGGDAVGMSTVPEAIVARHMGLRVAGISLLTNEAARPGRPSLDHREVLRRAESMRANLEKMLGIFLASFSA